MVGLHVIEYLRRVPWVWGFPWGFQWGFLWVWDGYGDWNAIPTAALNFRSELRKTHHLCSRVRYGRSRSSKVVNVGVNWTGLWDFVLVINGNLGLISHRFWDTLVKNRKFTLPLSCLPPSVGMTPFEFQENFANPKNRVLRKVDGEDLVI